MTVLPCIFHILVEYLQLYAFKELTVCSLTDTYCILNFKKKLNHNVLWYNSLKRFVTEVVKGLLVKAKIFQLSSHNIK